MNALLKKTGLVLPVVLVLLFTVVFSSGCEKKPANNEQPKTTTPGPETTGQPAPEANQPKPAPEVNQPQPAVAAPTTKTIYVRELEEIDQIDAERLMAVVPSGKKIGALPMTSYLLMVTTCRQIIQRWPDSLYAYKAKVAMAGLSAQDKQTFKITKEEADVSAFEKPRTGTQPYKVEQ
jgi:hypothetical protein